MTTKEKTAPHCNAKTATEKRPAIRIPKIIENVKLMVIFTLICGGFAVLGGVENGGIAISTALPACAVLTACAVMVGKGVKND